jgi:imidazole glycerol-phosphate synthase subunit HisH
MGVRKQDQVGTMIKVIDYKAGNAPSVMHAITSLGYKAEFAHQGNELADATHILLPGVGSAGATMESLRELNIITALEDAVFKKKIYFLGICVGLQILFQHSEEDDADCLGWLKGKVTKFDASKVRVPQMGWNKVFFTDSPINKKNAKEGYFYFVNSFHAKPENKEDLWGLADYNGQFTAAVHRDNIFATQFHVEKSGKAGLAILGGFLKLGKG